MIPFHTSKPHFIQIHFNIILPSTPKSSVVSTLQVLQPQFFVHFSSPPIRVTCPAYLILIILGEEYEPCRSSSCSFLQPPVTSSPLSLSILLSTLSTNNLNLCSSLNVRNQVSHPYKITGKLTVNRFSLRAHKLKERR
jgi:hypothetical protein